jgi:hypothetical protein
MKKITLFSNILCIIGLLIIRNSLAGPLSNNVTWPSGFDFASSIESEEYTMDYFQETYLDNLKSTAPQSDYGLALSNLTLGLERREPIFLGNAKSLFIESRKSAKGEKQRSLAQDGIAYTDKILSGDFTSGVENGEVVVPVKIKTIAPPKAFKTIVLGSSAILVDKHTKIKTQVDRVTRDWLQGFNIKNAPWALDPETVATWHEGQKIRELVKLTKAKAIPVTGTKAKRIGDAWYAPDAKGLYLFKISEDKIYNFPTNFVLDDTTAIINDTHGISALAWDALDANLVIGCGDSPGKMEAAYYLAEHGVNVYAPTDRYIGQLIGTDTQGIVIGTAPIKKRGHQAVIGDQPISIDAKETIVVSNTQGHYPLQYYDAPYRYFKALADYLGKPLDIVPVEVKAYGKADIVITEARKRGAQVIGIRVWGKQEHDAVAAWLTENSKHRAILFHSAVYPEGYKLFYEFPKQTSFGDTRPKFL